MKVFECHSALLAFASSKLDALVSAASGMLRPHRTLLTGKVYMIVSIRSTMDAH